MKNYWLSLLHTHVNASFENTQTNVYLKDTSGKYLGVNSVFEKISGYSQNDVVGNTDMDLWSPADAQNIKANDFQVISTQKTTVQLENVQLKLFLSIKTPLKNHMGSTIGLIGLSYLSENSIAIHEDPVFSLLALNTNKISSTRKKSSPVNKEYSLTNRQYDCLYYLLKGMTAKQMSIVLGISHRTVEDHIERLKIKFNCNDRYDLISNVLTIPYLRTKLLLDPEIIKK